jgi:hypothetical protein
MACATGDLSVSTKTGIEEQAFAEMSRARVVRDSVRGIRRQRFEFGDGERSQFGQLRG